jgi:GT2 family glycosyltransferase
MIKLSVIIVNYNVKDLLLKCLQSIYRFDTTGIEVVVIDNASIDGSEAAVGEHFPQVQFIANTENAGFPKANNQGFAVAKGETILMLNPDTELLDNAIQQLYSYLKSNPIAAVAPQLLNTDGSRQWSV